MLELGAAQVREAQVHARQVGIGQVAAVLQVGCRPEQEPVREGPACRQDRRARADVGTDEAGHGRAGEVGALQVRQPGAEGGQRDAGVGQVSAGEVGVLQVDARGVDASEVGVTEVGVRQDGSIEACAVQVSAYQVGPGRVLAAQVGARSGQEAALELPVGGQAGRDAGGDAARAHLGKGGAGEVRLAQVRAGQVGQAHHGAGQVST